MPSSEVNIALFRELDTQTLYKILRLRAQVFVVEQKCAYCDLDDRDTEPGARHLWIEEDGEVLTTLRVLEEPNEMTRVGRLCTAKAGRGRGLAATLLITVLDMTHGNVVLNGQSYLRSWYESFGFVVEGNEYLEDDIPHFHMRLKGTS